ncbi:MAG: LPS export ABC transporter ATP-binding protein [Pseudomonadota bacterium]|nr:LPS export ABC transporter ATP-binding protein [Pseudomonadota bacterium]
MANDARSGLSLAHDHMQSPSGLVADHIGKSYKRKRVVRSVSLSLKRGEAVGLLGPNGAGKTTCFYMMSGLLKADEGRILMDGMDITMLPMFKRSRQGIGYLPQESSIFQGLTVEQNIMAVLQLVEPDPDIRLTMLDELLDEFHISHLRMANAMTLSGGERRRVEIARALVTRPTFLMLDEPLAGIDPIAVGEIKELIGRLKSHGLGVLITDHNVRDTLSIVDRAYILNDGIILKSGSPQDIIEDPHVRDVYLGRQFMR